jgi:tryptophan synthase alpha chain
VLESYIAERRRDRPILLMTHIVIGYPSFEASLAVVDEMVAGGVDLIELQIPFSEPIADGPVIVRANQEALAAGSTIERCFELASAVTRKHAIPFLFMTYYNPLFRTGTTKFVKRMREAGLRGAIVPDLPPEEAGDYLSAMESSHLDPIFIYSPNTTDKRLRHIADHARGFVYCVARKGVTGSHTEFSTELNAYLERCRSATHLPLAVGFGVQSARDVAGLVGRADIAVVGSQTLRVIDEQGVGAVRAFVESLR